MLDGGAFMPDAQTIALAGRVVTMDKTRSVLSNHVVYVRDESIVDVRPISAERPAGFETARITHTRGTIYPGLIELHNHLPYDVLSLWQVPKQYGNRDQWSGASTPDYHRLVTGPMAALGSSATVTAAVVRYVEMRCLLGGTTTSQGVTLATAAGLVTHFRGLVRNVESTGDPALPPATTHIADVDAKDGQKFLDRISGGKKLILHLAEGTDESAHNHFKALEISPGKWAITDNLINIHCVALTDGDHAVLAAHGGSMVWSPISNLLLYGQTADVGAAIKHGVPVALGSDWSPSGSKNLLGELKVARLAAPLTGAPITDQDLVAMVTTTPAAMLGWDQQLGSIEQGKRADLIVVRGASGDPYTALVDASEASVVLVLINGVPRAGTPLLMRTFPVGANTETVSVHGEDRVLDLTESSADPDVAKLSVAEAETLLRQALHDLPNHAHLANPMTAVPAGQLRLAVKGLVSNGMVARHQLPYQGQMTGVYDPANRVQAAEAAVAIGPLPSLPLDPLTAVDNPSFYDTMRLEMNLPGSVRGGLLRRRPRG
jgi:cytosine/adenosine deaminase-related metal-dependent hydrolase